MGIRIALAGNPNCGKTTLFNALTGSNQFVGNWPGVTVEYKEGTYIHDKDVKIVDLPGIYSLSPYTLEEVVARNYLVDEKPEAIINVVDGTNIERNLYLTTQVVELGIPVVIAINMMDVVAKKGDIIYTDALSKEIGVPVIEISALKNTGMEEVVAAAVEAAKEAHPQNPKHNFGGAVEHALAHIEELCLHNLDDENLQRWYSIKLFERDEKIQEKLGLLAETVHHIEKDITSCEKEMDDDAESIITNERYNYITSIIGKCVYKAHRGISISDKIDQIVTHRIFALPIFALVMFIVYYVTVTTIGTACTDWVNDGLFGDGWYWFGNPDKFQPGIPVLLEAVLDAMNCNDMVKGLVLDGIVAGVGAVLGFVPQIFVLFAFLAFLEACGYMSRVAFIMDRIFRKIGLSGKSFIPMLVSTGCGVPGIMASRTIENDRDRKMTIMTTTFIPCSAKLPFIAMIAGAIFGGAAWVAPAAYFLGICAVIISGLILKKSRLFVGDVSPFVMELPPYHWPPIGNVLRSMWERGWSFIKKAGTIIFLSTIVVWFLTFFGPTPDGFRMLGDSEIGMSLLAKLGGLISWIFIPVGFGHWEAAVATLTGLVAKENIVGTLAIIYGVSGDTYQNIANAFSPAAGFAFMAFNLLCAPCFAAMGAIKREMNNAKWFWIAVGYQCGFAWLVALIIYQLGELLNGGTFGIGTIFGFAAIGVLAYFVCRKARNKK